MYHHLFTETDFMEFVANMPQSFLDEIWVKMTKEKSVGSSHMFDMSCYTVSRLKLMQLDKYIDYSSLVAAVLQHPRLHHFRNSPNVQQVFVAETLAVEYGKYHVTSE